MAILDLTPVPVALTRYSPSMDSAVLVETAKEIGLQFPATELTHPFGPEWDVLKVKGRVFLLATEVTGEPMVTVKVEPLDGEGLRMLHPEISPGYHMNKKHWVSIVGGDTVGESALREIVLDSYCLVVAKLPKKDRPVDPATFGGREEFEKVPE